VWPEAIITYAKWGDTLGRVEPCGAASRSARPRVCRYALAPSRVAGGSPSPGRAARAASSARGRAGTSRPTCGATRRPAVVVSLLRFLRASSLVSIVYDLGYTIPYNGLRRAYRGTHRG